MQNNIYKESYKELLSCRVNISIEMNEVILLKYFDKLGINNKYLLSLFNESYKSAFIVCEAIKNGCVSQAAVVLRLLLESSSIIRVLIDYPDLLEKYVKHFKIRLDISHTPNKERSVLENSFPNVESNKRLSYMDYGWFESKLEPKIKNGKLDIPKPSETELIRLAKFDDIIEWKKLYLDKISHQSFMMENMINSNGEIPILTSFLEILCKLFDCLCCDFHQLTNFDFVFDGLNVFQDKFRNLYKNEDFK